MLRLTALIFVGLFASSYAQLIGVAAPPPAVQLPAGWEIANTTLPEALTDVTCTVDGDNIILIGRTEDAQLSEGTLYFFNTKNSSFNGTREPRDGYSVLSSLAVMGSGNLVIAGGGDGSRVLYYLPNLDAFYAFGDGELPLPTIAACSGVFKHKDGDLIMFVSGGIDTSVTPFGTRWQTQGLKVSLPAENKTTFQDTQWINTQQDMQGENAFGTFGELGRNKAGCAQTDDHLYVIGGRGNGNGGGLSVTTGFDTTLRMDPSVYTNKTWEKMTPIPEPRGGLSCVTLGTEIHCFGGETSNVAGDIQSRMVTAAGVYYRHDIYDTVKDSWTSKAMPFGSHSFCAAQVDDKVYFFGGGVKAGTSSSNAIYIYTPALDTETATSANVTANTTSTVAPIDEQASL